MDPSWCSRFWSCKWGALRFKACKQIAGNAVPLCDVFFAEIEGTTKLLAPSNARYALYGNTYTLILLIILFLLNLLIQS